MIQEEKLSGFVGGTLIHTENGLVLIRDIKVGDMVLYKDEKGEGELVYKPVIRTIRTENSPVFFASFRPESINSVPFHKRKDPNLWADIIMTSNHPFWIEGKGWIAAEHIEMNDMALLKDVELARFIGGGSEDNKIDVIFKTDQPYEGYIPDFHSDTNSGRFVNIETGRSLSYGGYDPIFRKLFIEDTLWRERLLAQTPVEHRENAEFYGFRQGFWQDGAEIDWAEGEGPVTTIVYNLEVADAHTYFVGEHGVWVHDASANIS